MRIGSEKLLSVNSNIYHFFFITFHLIWRVVRKSQVLACGSQKTTFRETILGFHSVGPGDGSQIVRLDSRSHILTAPICHFPYSTLFRAFVNLQLSYGRDREAELETATAHTEHWQCPSRGTEDRRHRYVSYPWGSLTPK